MFEPGAVKLARDAGFEPEPLEAFRVMLRERLLTPP
jgi:hypothetical protein